MNHSNYNGSSRSILKISYTHSDDLLLAFPDNRHEIYGHMETRKTVSEASRHYKWHTVRPIQLQPIGYGTFENRFELVQPTWPIRPYLCAVLEF